MSTQTERTYPRVLECEGGNAFARKMAPSDEAAIVAFAEQLPTHDLLFLPRDISQPKVIAAWLREIDRGALTSVVATLGDKIVGCGTIARDPLSWSPHVGELRIVVAPEVRQRGLGRALIQEVFALALSLGLLRLVAQMTSDQRAAIAVFEGLGFRPEGLLRDHVQGPDGIRQDIVILGHDVGEAQARLVAYGLAEAV